MTDLKRKCVALFLILGLSAMLAYAVIVVADIRVPLLNPPDTENSIPLPIYYYLSNESYLAGFPRGTADYSVEVDLFHNGTLVVGKPVFAIAHGYLQSQEALDTVERVLIGFKLSHAYPPQVFSETLTTLDIVISLHRYGTNELRGNTVMIYWATSGDFPLITATIFKDNRTWISTSDLPAVHVEPFSQLNAERTNRVNEGLTVALTYFAFVEGASRVYDYVTEKRKTETRG